MFAAAGIKFDKDDNSDIIRNITLNTDVSSLLQKGKEEGIKDFFVLKTCNRFEVYCNIDSLYKLAVTFFGTHQMAVMFIQRAKIFFGLDAARHLFKVASSLDSQLLGDYEISAQVRDAAKQAKQIGCLGSVLEYWVNSALAASKEIKTQTGICKGYVSYASLAVNEAVNNYGSLQDKQIVVYGLGKIGRNLTEYLMKHTNARDVILVNRSIDKASAIAAKHGIGFAPEQELATLLFNTDILFVCTGANEHVITPTELTDTKVQWVADLSQPANVDPAITTNGVTLLDLAEMTNVFNQNLDERKKEVPAALVIIKKHLGEMAKRSRLKKYMNHALTWKSLGYETIYCNPQTDTVVNRESHFVQHFMKQMNMYVQSDTDSACAFLKVMNEIGMPQNLN